MRSLIRRWKAAGQERLGLDIILSHASAQMPLSDRIEWLIELFQWLRLPGKIDLANDDHKTGILQTTRLRYLLTILEKNPIWKQQTSETLRSILKDTNAFNLFCATGLPGEASFFSEAVNRFTSLALPSPPRDGDLAEVFSSLFSSIDDIQWLQRIDATTLNEIWALFSTPPSNETPANSSIGEKLKLDMEESLLFLTGQVRTYGLEPQLRRRMSQGRIQTLPFFEITFSGRNLIQHLHSKDLFTRREAISSFRETVARCRRELKEAHAHLDEYGVSVTIVYQLDRIGALLNRIEVLVRILAGENQDPKRIVLFLCTLITELHKQRGLKSLFGENLSLISMKIAQRSAETGSHYISQTREEYLAIFSKSAGGGFITAFTALVKILIENLRHFAYFFQGMLTSVTYSVSFVWIYLAGFTLATKQPAMTANALAEKMENLESEISQESLINEIVNLIRSQVGATLGNMASVIPTVIAINVILFYLSGQSLLSTREGLAILDKHSAFGLSPIHAAFTGVLLWMSSIVAGWVDNWSVYREMPQAIAANRRLKKLLGPTRLQHWADSYQKNLAGWAGNVSLGFLLGMSPKILGFFGLPLDVRHVTLSTGVITFAASSVGFGVFTASQFWWAVLGIVFIGLANISVAFFLALFVALRSRRIEGNLREMIYELVWKRFRTRPLTFFWFPKAKVELK